MTSLETGEVKKVREEVRDNLAESPVSLITFNSSDTGSSSSRTTPVVVSDTIIIMEDNAVTLSFICAEITDGITLDPSIEIISYPQHGTISNLILSEQDGQLAVFTATSMEKMSNFPK